MSQFCHKMSRTTKFVSSSRHDSKSDIGEIFVAGYSAKHCLAKIPTQGMIAKLASVYEYSYMVLCRARYTIVAPSPQSDVLSKKKDLRQCQVTSQSRTGRLYVKRFVSLATKLAEGINNVFFFFFPDRENDFVAFGILSETAMSRSTDYTSFSLIF